MNTKRTKQPLVSVVMPVYNAGSYVVEAIESILKQTYKNFEFIIVDDVSTDNSATIIAKYAKRYPDKIKVLTMTENLNGGGDKCANEGVKVAKGTYIARMDADDIAHEDRLAKQVAYLESHPKTFLVGSNAFVIDKKGKTIGEKTEPLTHKAIYDAYFTFHPMIHPTCMIRRIMPNGKPFTYDIRYKANNDYYTFFTLLCKGYKFANLEDKLLYYRIHGKNDTFVHMKNKFMNTFRIRVKMAVKYGYKPSVKSVATTLVQGIVVLLLPETVVTKLYLVSKGIISKNELIKQAIAVSFVGKWFAAGRI